MNKRTTNSLLFMAAFLTIMGVGLPILSVVESTPLWWTIVSLHLLFFFTFIICVFYFNSQAATRVYLSIDTALIVSIFLIGIGSGHIGDSSFNLFFILSSCAALLLPLREAALWIIGFIAIQSGLIVYNYSWTTLLGWSSFIGGHFMFASVGYLMRAADREREKTESLYSELQQTHAQLQEQAANAEKLAVAEERNRLAREMHDSLGHRLTVAVLQLEGAQRLIPTEPDRAGEMVGSMRAQLKESLAELRKTLSTLRAPEEESAPNQAVHAVTRPRTEESAPLSSSLRADLTEMVQTFRGATGLAVHLKITADLPVLSPPQRLGIYCAAQELLTNVHRHAEAQNAWVDLALVADSGHESVLLQVADDGRGMPAETSDARFGLQGLRERAGQLAGSFELTARDRGGTVAQFQIPIMMEAVHV